MDFNKLESELGFTLPADYRQFLLEDDLAQYKGLTFTSIHRDGFRAQKSIYHLFSPESLIEDNKYRDFLEELQEHFELGVDYVESEKLFLIGDTGNGTICMAFSGRHAGKIYSADNGDFGIIYQSESLHEFLSGLS